MFSGKISPRLFTGKETRDSARQENVGCLLELWKDILKYGSRNACVLRGREDHNTGFCPSRISAKAKISRGSPSFP